MKMVEKVRKLVQAIKTLKLPAVVAFGNPLLDIVVVLEDDELLKKYNLKMDGELELPEKKLQQLIADLPAELMSVFDGGGLVSALLPLECRKTLNIKVITMAIQIAEQTISAGGSAQNTLRILQWLCGSASTSPIGIYYGGLGKDARGNMLESLVRAAGVDTRYAVHPTLPTGVCVSLISGSSRSLAANIGAAGVYTLDDVLRCKYPRDAIKIVYIEGFFVTHSLDVAKQLVELTRDTKIISAFNLNGVYIFQDHHDAIFEMVGLAKIVFGNAREMIALAQALDLKFDDVTDIPFLLNNLKRVTVGVSSLSNKDWLSDEGVFIMTQGGSSPAIAVWGQGQSVQVQPMPPKSPVVDTTGAGDALVAGFLAGVLAGWDPKNCLEYGCKVASFMVTRLGVTLPNFVPPDLLQ